MIKRIDNFFEKLDNSLVFNRIISCIAFFMGFVLLVDFNMPNDLIEELLAEMSISHLMSGQFFFGFLSCFFINGGINFMIRCNEIRKDRKKEK